jgi:hypothetical protein
MFRVSRSVCYVALAFLSACASTGVLSAARVNTEPTPSEKAMLEDYKDGTLDHIRPARAALIVGGTRDPAELDAQERALNRAIDMAVRYVEAKSPSYSTAWGSSIDLVGRGRLLLTALYTGLAGESPILAKYEARSTTVYDVLTTGRYNCVSATFFYLLAAERLGLDARPVLLPSHARAVLVVSGKRYVVETTSREGFDPSPEQQQRALDRARPKQRKGTDLYADEKGTEVDFEALLAATYGNISIFSYEKGDHALAASLMAREAALTAPAALPMVRAQQMSLLTQLALRKSDEGQSGAAVGYALRAAEAAADDKAKRFAEQNLVAFAVRELLDHQATWSEEKMMAFPERFKKYPTAYENVQTEVYAILSQRLAAGGPASERIRGLLARNSTRIELSRLEELSVSDAEAAWTAWKQLEAPADRDLYAQQQKVGTTIAENRSLFFANEGRCKELAAALREAPTVGKQQELMTECRSRQAGALVKRVDGLLRDNRCKEARPLIAEGLARSTDKTFFRDASAFCKKR